jgi:hypothetical protein
MVDDNKKWYEVEGWCTIFFGYNVQASSEVEAERLYWESDVEVHEMQNHIDDLEIVKVKECEESDVTHDLTHRLTVENIRTHNVDGSANAPSL